MRPGAYDSTVRDTAAQLSRAVSRRVDEGATLRESEVWREAISALRDVYQRLGNIESALGNLAACIRYLEKVTDGRIAELEARLRAASDPYAEEEE